MRFFSCSSPISICAFSVIFSNFFGSLNVSAFVCLFFCYKKNIFLYSVSSVFLDNHVNMCSLPMLQKHHFGAVRSILVECMWVLIGNFFAYLSEPLLSQIIFVNTSTTRKQKVQIVYLFIFWLCCLRYFIRSFRWVFPCFSLFYTNINSAQKSKKVRFYFLMKFFFQSR